MWAAVEKDPESFWRGDIIEHPKNDTQKLRGQEFSYYDYLMGEPELEPVFLYCLHMRRKKGLKNLRRNYALGMTLEHETVARSLLAAQGLRLCGDDSITLGRKMIQSEMKAIQDIVARDETVFEAVNSAPETEVTSSSPAKTSSDRMSVLVEKYVSDSAQERAWPKKTLLRKKAELAEFIELCGDKPANQYTQADGVAFSLNFSHM